MRPVDILHTPYRTAHEVALMGWRDANHWHRVTQRQRRRIRMARKRRRGWV